MSSSLKRPRHQSIGSPDIVVDSMINPYHILQVRRDATPPEIRQAYKRLALWHHPARNTTTKDSTFAVFTTLAASYETLMDAHARHAYDVLLKKQFRGEVLVGGKLWSSSSNSAVYFQQQQQQAVATKEQILHREGMPALVMSISLDEGDGDYDSDDDDDDSMTLLRQARRNRPFLDPFDVFDAVFGSRLYPHLKAPDKKRRPPLSKSSNQQPRSAAWTGSTRTLKDGSFVSTTSRILGNRQLTRTEQIYCSKEGSHTTTHVMVMSRELSGLEEPTKRCGTTAWLETMQEFFDDWVQSMCMCANMFPEYK
jgi:curved DNA-binding protein CbpA